jgi:phenylacetic acid degradation operon negative regulatory protein
LACGQVAGATGPYDGTWWLAVVTTAGSTAEVRTARRRALAYARLAELREGVWMRPSNVTLDLPRNLESDVETMPACPERPAELAERLWDLTSWSARAGALRQGLDRIDPDRPEALAPGFELSASILRHLQSDPLLPAELLPERWPGASLRSAYDMWDARYRATLREWSRET